MALARSAKATRRSSIRVAAALIAAALSTLTGCALVSSPGDRLLAERDFAAARDAYLLLLENRQSGRRIEGALYNLALLYLQSDPDLYDPVAAEEALIRLTYIRPRSAYAARAALLLELQRETRQLEVALDAQQALTFAAEERLASLARAATETEARSEDQSKKVGRLGNRIAGLEAQIVKLHEELGATGRELTKREEELERLKRIDLEEP